MQWPPEAAPGGILRELRHVNEDCVTPFLFLQRPLILWMVFTSQDTCSLSTSSDCSSRGLDKDSNTRTQLDKLFRY